MARGRATRIGAEARRDAVRFIDSYASLLLLLLANFFLLELVDDLRWGRWGAHSCRRPRSWSRSAIPSRAIASRFGTGSSSPRASPSRPIVLIVNSVSLVGLTYLLPVALLVTATLPVTISRVLHHRRVTYETVLGALCAYVLIGLLFAFVYLAVEDFRDTPFFAQPGPHDQGEFLYFSFVALTTLGFGDLSPSVGLPQALTVLEALIGSIFLVTLVARLVTLWVRQDAELRP